MLSLSTPVDLCLDLLKHGACLMTENFCNKPAYLGVTDKQLGRWMWSSISLSFSASLPPLECISLILSLCYACRSQADGALAMWVCRAKNVPIAVANMILMHVVRPPVIHVLGH